MGIEPTSSAWKAEVLPLNYTRLMAPHPPAYLDRSRLFLLDLDVVEGEGFEPSKA